MLGDDPFLVMNADIFHKIKLENLPDFVEYGHLIGVPNPEHNIHGDFSLSNNFVNINTNSNKLTWSGISVINPVIFKENAFESNSFNMWDAVLLKYINKIAITGQTSFEPWLDVGTLERLKLANSVYNNDN